ncbi:hypothetical protein [Micromonospora sp. IBHARD004]|uniref:hypothetical protein n=1 Tax=Micromonospora sp. IBHARD004 TaxID=3457764 RepID=UPI004058A42A
MSAPAWAVVAALTGVLLVLAAAGWRWHARARAKARRVLTREQKLAAGRQAVRQMGRSGPRPRRYPFDTGGPPGDGYPGTFAQNSWYGDAAGHGGSDGGGSDGGSY